MVFYIPQAETHSVHSYHHHQDANTKENNGMMLLERQRSARKGGKRKGRKKKRLRSRNKYVDTHLESESGDDAYADLEDFIVGEDDEID